eukprot:gene3081-3852_t
MKGSTKIITSCVLIFFQFYISYIFGYPQNIGTCTHNWTGETVYFYEYLPPTYNNGTPAPVIVFFHGLGEVGKTLQSLPLVLINGIPKLINNNEWPLSFPFVVISPQVHTGYGGLHEYRGLLNILQSRYGNKIDYTRIYLTGLSAGGWANYLAASAHANTIAAMVPVCTASFSENWVNTIASANIPIWNFVNLWDSLRTVSTGITDLLNNAGIQPRVNITIYNTGGHDAWTETYKINNNPNNIYDWMLKWTNQRTHVTLTPSPTVSPTPSPTVSPTPSPTVSPTSSPTPSSGSSWSKKQRPTYGYWEFIPSFSTNGKYPLLINFHGADSFGNGNNTDLNVLLPNSIPYYIQNNQWPSSYPFLVICPQTLNAYWDDSPAVFDDILSTYSNVIDMSRIYVTGQGRGANGIVNLFKNNLTRANKIAAVVPIRIFGGVHNATADIMVQSHVPSWWMCNLDDPYAPPIWTQDWYNYLVFKNSNPQQLFNPTGGAEYNSKYKPTNPAVSNIYSWLLTKSR